MSLRQDFGDRVGRKFDALVFGRHAQRAAGVIRWQAVDLDELEQPLRIGFGASGQAEELRQACADQRDRRFGLGRQVNGGEQRAELRLGDIL